MAWRKSLNKCMPVITTQIMDFKPQDSTICKITKVGFSRGDSDLERWSALVYLLVWNQFAQVLKTKKLNGD